MLALGGLAYFTGSDDMNDWVTDGMARSGQEPSAPLQRVTGARGDRVVMVGNEVGPRWVSTDQRVAQLEALPCTEPGEPINFEVFSAGPAVAGVPMTAVARRCDAGALADEATSNYFAYIYGKCQPQDGTGCLPPLQIRSYPACQRNFAEYSFEGKPLPHKELAPVGAARVIEIEFLVDHRIEIYTGDSTVVISAADWSLAEKALQLLKGQPRGEVPVATASSLAQEPRERLDPPVKEAIEGDPPCHV